MIKIEHKEGDSNLIIDFKYYIKLKNLTDCELLAEWYKVSDKVGHDVSHSILNEMVRRMKN
jgi:hypothetical protein